MLDEQDMDLYDESRTLVYSGPLVRLSRSDSGWSSQATELTGSLMDNYCKCSVVIPHFSKIHSVPQSF
jgi:hypothetical protein